MSRVDLVCRPGTCCLNCRLGLILMIGFAWLSAPLIGRSQDASLEDLQQQWSKLDQQLSEKLTSIESGEGDIKALQNEYRDLVDQASGLVKQLKSTAINALKENPRDKSVTRSIMGILLNDAENGREKEVLSIGDMLIAQQINPRYFEIAAKADRLSIKAKEIFEELLIRQRETAADDLPRVKLTTTQGEIVLELYENQAPNTVRNFISLVESGYYTDMLFHRVLQDFMAQTGESKSDGSGKGGPGYTIECECYTPEARPHFSHCISMALRGKDTGGGQFFLTFSRTDFLDGKHTVFGRVNAGGDILDKIVRTHISINGREEPIPNIEKDKIISAEVIRKRDHEYKPVKVGDPDPKPELKQEKPPADPNLSGPDSAKDNVQTNDNELEESESDESETENLELEELKSSEPDSEDKESEAPESESLELNGGESDGDDS